MKQRVITAVVALAFFLPVIYVGGIAIELTAGLLSYQQIQIKVLCFI